MSIRAYASAIRSADVLPAVLSRPIAEYARADDAYFAAHVLGRDAPSAYTFIIRIPGHSHPRIVTAIFSRYVWDGFDRVKVPWNTRHGIIEIEFQVGEFVAPISVCGTWANAIESICSDRPAGITFGRSYIMEVGTVVTRLFMLMREDMIKAAEGAEK